MADIGSKLPPVQNRQISLQQIENAGIVSKDNFAQLTPAELSRLNLSVFDTGKEWKPLFEGPKFGQVGVTGGAFSDRVKQRRFIDSTDHIFTETQVRLKAPPERIVEELRKRDFYANGEVEAYKPQKDGSITYTLWPGTKSVPVKVNERMQPPKLLPDGSVAIMIDMTPKPEDRPALLNGTIKGTAYFLIKPRGDGTSDVSMRFSAVERTKPAPLSAAKVAESHLLAERGNWKSQGGLLSPFVPENTGFGPALERAEHRLPWQEADDAAGRAAGGASKGWGR